MGYIVYLNESLSELFRLYFGYGIFFVLDNYICSKIFCIKYKGENMFVLFFIVIYFDFNIFIVF